MKFSSFKSAAFRIDRYVNERSYNQLTFVHVSFPVLVIYLSYTRTFIISAMPGVPMLLND